MTLTALLRGVPSDDDTSRPLEDTHITAISHRNARPTDTVSEAPRVNPHWLIRVIWLRGFGHV